VIIINLVSIYKMQLTFQMSYPMRFLFLFHEFDWSIGGNVTYWKIMYYFISKMTRPNIITLTRHPQTRFHNSRMPLPGQHLSLSQGVMWCIPPYSIVTSMIKSIKAVSQSCCIWRWKDMSCTTLNTMHNFTDAQMFNYLLD